MSKHWKILSLLLLALIGVFAVNASAAQAEWLLLLNKKSISSMNMVGGSSEKIYILSEAGIKISCEKFTGANTAKLSEGKTVLSESATFTFTGCKENKFTTCTIHSPGQPGGTIVAKGEGHAEMETANEETVWVKAASAEFTTFIIEGSKCPVNEAEEVISGTVKVTVLNSLKDLKVHEIHIEGVSLKIGGSNAELHMLNEKGEPLPSILGSFTDEDPTATFALHLCKLTGAPTCP